MVEDIDSSVEEIVGTIKELYQADEVPWVIGYSGGKDSSACVQLVWRALEELPLGTRKKPVHVISTDTLVENPVVASWVTRSLEKMESAAKAKQLPIKPHRLVPELKNRFWVNLIGRGYPAPRPRFRWCTERLKIQTATKFIQNLAETNGEAILVLGTRRAESAARAKTISKYEKSTRAHLSRNADPKLSRVWIYTPVVDWDNDDVWEFIGTYENPWGVPSSELLDLYRGATPDNECPLVTDTQTQSCGDSRFGCYVCTMVSQDKSMQAMILNDESKAWMQPIMDLRDNFLAPNEKERENREFRRLGSNRLILMNGKLVHGPYTQSYRLELLKQLLRVQRQVREDGAKSGFNNVDLISREELDEIRRIWVEEKGEIEDHLPLVYEEVMKEPYSSEIENEASLQAGDFALLEKTCSEWMQKNMPTQDKLTAGQREHESYALIRSLLANVYTVRQTKKRSQQLDAIGEIFEAFAFADEESALEYAKKYIGDDKSMTGTVNLIELQEKNAEDLVAEEELPENQRFILT